jgi:hypothetical protein
MISRDRAASSCVFEHASRSHGSVLKGFSACLTFENPSFHAPAFSGPCSLSSGSQYTNSALSLVAHRFPPLLDFGFLPCFSVQPLASLFIELPWDPQKWAFLQNPPNPLAVLLWIGLLSKPSVEVRDECFPLSSVSKSADYRMTAVCHLRYPSEMNESLGPGLQ